MDRYVVSESDGGQLRAEERREQSDVWEQAVAK